MPEKLGKGGNGPQDYDPQTGKYGSGSGASGLLGMFEKRADAVGDGFGSYDATTDPVLFLTPEEAYAGAADELRKIRSSGLAMANWLSYKDPRVALAQLRALNKCLSDFPLDGFGKILFTTEATEDGVAGFTTAGYYSGGRTVSLEDCLDGARVRMRAGKIVISFNSESGSGARDLILARERSQTFGFHDDPGSDEAKLCQTVFHEYGHNVQRWLANKMLDDGLFPQPTMKRADYSKAFSEALDAGATIDGAVKKARKPIEKQWNDLHAAVNETIIKKAKEMYPDRSEEELMDDVSEYGKKSAREWFAETFASMMSGNPRPVALAMREVLRGYFGR